MRDLRHRATSSQRPESASAAIPNPLSRALFRRQTLDEQQRTFQGSYPPPHLLRRRPPA